MIYVNGRNLGIHTTGVQRYTKAIVDQLMISNAKDISIIQPLSPLHGIKGHLWEQGVIPNKLKRGDVLWSPSNTGPLYCSSKHVVTMHDTATIDHPEWTSKKFNLLYQFILPKIARKADKLIAISEFTKSKMLEHFNIKEDKIVVIPNGVDISFFNPDVSFFSMVKKKYNIPSFKFILSVSSIEPRKNIKNLIKAWLRICNRVDDDIWLVLAGRKNPHIFSDIGITELPPRVHFTGYIDDADLPCLYGAAMLFVYPSLYEGFGLPPLEAMATGVPVLTSNSTSIPEVVGDSAVMINPIAVNDIAENMFTLINDSNLRCSLSIKGIERAKTFSWEKTAKKTIDVLKSIDAK